MKQLDPMQKPNRKAIQESTQEAIREPIMGIQWLLSLSLFIAAILTLMLPNQAAASNNGLADIPQHAPDQHLGVATCASSFCHGSTTANDQYSVLQNEYTIWSKADAHSKAYETLLKPESQRIARKLGLQNAHEAAVCLDCHADNVPAAKRGEKFQITDGVGCEACHGGSENWISSHVAEGNNSAASHSANIANGLYPTDQPEARAKLCMSCHIGTPDKFATHDIMGAGHPRLSFELTTFSAIQPAHYRIDNDYYQRKIAEPDAKVWAIGQIQAAKRTALNLTNRQLLGRGLFPELAVFDCHACHHPMDQQRWAPNQARAALGTGEIRLNDSQLTLVRPILAHYDLPLAKRYLAGIQRLHAASLQSRSAMMSAAKQLANTLDQAQQLIGEKDIQAQDALALMEQLSWRGAQGQYRDYAAAEHAVMGLQVLAETAGIRDGLNSELDRLFKALGNENRYAPYQANRAFKRMQNQLKQLDSVN